MSEEQELTDLPRWESILQASRPALDAYAEVLRRFVALIDSRKELTLLNLLKRLDVMLPELYFCSRALPEAAVWWGPDDDDGEWPDSSYELPGLAKPGWSIVFDLKETFGEYDLFLEVFDPYRRLSEDPQSPQWNEPIDGTLSDHLASVYGEADWLKAYDRGTVRDLGQAAHHWRDYMDSTLVGEAVTGAMRAVRALIFDHAENWEPVDEEPDDTQPLA